MAKPGPKPVLKTMKTRLENELKGAKRYRDQLEDYVPKNPSDDWAAGQLRHYRKRVEELEARLANLE